MKPMEVFWMASFGAVFALPARPATFDYVTAGGDTYLPTSPYSVTLKAHAMADASSRAVEPVLSTNLMALLVLVMLGTMLFILRAVPPAPVVIAALRQAFAAALARSRTRSTIARSPFDL